MKTFARALALAGAIACGPSGDTGAPVVIPELPELTVEWFNEAQVAPGYLLVAFVSSPPAAALIDRDGTVIWARAQETDQDNILTTHAILGAEPGQIFYNVYSSLRDGGDGETSVHQIIESSYLGGVTKTLAAPDLHHDFTVLPDSSLAWLAYDLRDTKDGKKRGDKIIERDLNGTLSTVWSSWDHYDYATAPDEAGSASWSHANALRFDEVRDEYQIGLRNYGHIVGIDRTTGDVNWTFGEDGDFSLAEGGIFPTQQHHFQLYENTLVVFDNGPRENLDSNAVAYELNWENMTAREIWRFASDPPLYSYGLGDADRLPNGNTLVTWSSPGQIDEVSPAGDVLWRLNTALGAAIGYIDWVETIAR